MATQEKLALSGGKGPDMEERLRSYFLNLGYFVVRGIKYQFNNTDVTDIDLWLYLRATPISRERINVDIKNKKTPQAHERIFWTKGIQEVLGLERCIVATTDSRADVASFSQKHDVTLLDGNFLSRLGKSTKSSSNRISEEEFLAILDDFSVKKLAGDWRRAYENGKGRLLTNLDFDGTNQWLKDIGELIDIFSAGPTIGNAALRLLYSYTSFLMVTVDFLSQVCINYDLEQRKSFLTDGFRYGNKGKIAADNIIKVAAKLSAATTGAVTSIPVLTHEFTAQFSSLKSEVLGEFFAKAGLNGTIIEVAKEFEAAAFDPSPPYPEVLSLSAKSVIGTLADYFGRDRKTVLIHS